MLLEWAGNYLMRLLKKDNLFLNHFPEDVHSLITDLAINRLPYQEEYDQILSRQGWKRNDTYLCINVLFDQEDGAQYLLTGTAVSLNTMIENQYIILEKQSIIQIINLNKTQLTESEIMQRLSLLSQHNPLAIGVSDRYEGLETVNIHCRQALVAAQKILKEKSKRIGKFDRMLPELMLDRIFQSEDLRFYLTHHIRNLLDYDRAKGTELMKTLRVYLQSNKSATRAQKILHISRATCLYRIRRIEEISGFNLDQPDTCLYLEILFMEEKYANTPFI